MKGLKVNKISTMDDYPKACEVPVEERVSGLFKRQEKILETQDAILDYLEHTMGIELVRTVKTSHLRFADKDYSDA